MVAPVISGQTPILPAISDETAVPQKTTLLGTKILGNPYPTDARPASLPHEKPTISPSTDLQSYLEQFQQLDARFNQSQVMRHLLDDGNKKITPPAGKAASSDSASTVPQQEIKHYSQSAKRGACMAFCALWMREIADNSNELAPERLNRLRAMSGSEAAILQKVYTDYGRTNDNADSAYQEVLDALTKAKEQLRPEIDAKKQQIDHVKSIVNQNVDAANGMITQLGILIADYNAHVRLFNQKSAGEQSTLSPMLEKKKQEIQQLKQQLALEQASHADASKQLNTLIEESNALVSKINQYTAQQSHHINIHNEIIENRNEEISNKSKQILHLTGMVVTEHFTSGNTKPDAFMASLADKIPPGSCAEYDLDFTKYGEYAGHATVLFRLNEDTVIFFDPNYGEYPVPARELGKFLSAFVAYYYADCELPTQSLSLVTPSDGKGDILAIQSKKLAMYNKGKDKDGKETDIDKKRLAAAQQSMATYQNEKGLEWVKRNGKWVESTAISEKVSPSNRPAPSVAPVPSVTPRPEDQSVKSVNPLPVEITPAISSATAVRKKVSRLSAQSASIPQTVTTPIAGKTTPAASPVTGKKSFGIRLIMKMATKIKNTLLHPLNKWFIKLK